MEKIKNDQLKNVIDKICFYDFENSICNRDVIHIQLSNEKNDIIYSNIIFEKERKIFEDKKRKIILLVDNIIKEMKDEKCIIIKYNDKWICNKKITKKLYRELKKNNIKIKETKAIMINLYEEKYYLMMFVEACLKYNSFVDFVFLNDEVVFSVTDHMDVFIYTSNDNFIKKIFKCVENDENFDIKLISG